ncbi:hypothetical protein FRC06_008374 [Ceratobasidium sp. 370]|nr:hypothetical protein FRC06_008374 [Ceratobasidium sp. 370]
MSDSGIHLNQASDAESDAEPENDGQHYYLNALSEPYTSLNILGRPPLFILKDVWDDKPRPKGTTHERYLQILDTRTRLQMLISSGDELTRASHGIVEWTDRSTRDRGKEGNDEGDQSSSSESCESQGPLGQQPEGQIALPHADIADWSADDNGDEEVLSIWSSEGEGQETGELPTRLSIDSKYADLRELAAQMLAEIERVERTPFVSDE